MTRSYLGADQPDPSQLASEIVEYSGPPPGERYGDYEVIKPLASGGMADIFLARKLGVQGFQKLVVVKRIRRELVKDESLIHMFLDEAHLAAKLDHPNVVVITDLGEVEDSYFMAMEYLRGQTLRTLQTKIVDDGKMLPPQFWCRLMEYALDGLHYAHELRGDDGKALNLVHRDFTPSNIMITYKGTVKVIDFGVARVEAPQLHETKIGSIKGKVSYLSPEQCLAKPLDRRSDVFAAGIVLWELLSRRRLFDGPAETAIIIAVMHDPIPTPGWEGQPIDAELSEIVMKALERDVSKRWQTAADMRDALRAYLRKQEQKVDASDLAEVMSALFASEREADDRLANRDASKSNPLPRRDSSKSGSKSGATSAGSRSGSHSGSARGQEVLAAASAPKSKVVPIAIGGGVVLALAVAGGVWMTHKTPEPQPPPPVVVQMPPPTKVEPPPPVKVEPPPPVKVEPPPNNETAQNPPEDKHHHKSGSSGVEATGGYGLLDFDTRPYTAVFIGKKKVGDTPLLEAKVPAGKVTLTLINEEAGIHETYIVTVPKDGKVTKKLKL